MIAMATHGYTGLKKRMFGSVARGFLDKSHIPVLLIGPKLYGVNHFIEEMQTR